MTKRSRNGSRKSKKSSESKFKTPGARVVVNWQDAWSSRGWKDASDVTKAHGALNVQSLGFVQLHNETGISIAYGKDENGTWLGQEFIPSGMIKEVVEI